MLKHSENVSRGGLSRRELLSRTWKEMWRDEVFGQAARLAFHFFLAFIPGLLLLWLILAKFAEAGFDLRGVLSETLCRMLSVQSSAVVSSAVRQTGHIVGASALAISVAGAVCAALNGMWAVITGLNRAYEIDEGRPMWKAFLVAAGLMAA